MASTWPCKAHAPYIACRQELNKLPATLYTEQHLLNAEEVELALPAETDSTAKNTFATQEVAL